MVYCTVPFLRRILNKSNTLKYRKEKSVSIYTFNTENLGAEVQSHFLCVSVLLCVKFECMFFEAFILVVEV